MQFFALKNKNKWRRDILLSIPCFVGQDDTKGSGPFFVMYKIFLIFWISFGLGYIVMIMTFIARGMRSKKITRLEHKLAMNLKHTQSKIWNEFNKEVNYLRRVFNELQLSKVKVSDLLNLVQTFLSNRIYIFVCRKNIFCATHFFLKILLFFFTLYRSFLNKYALNLYELVF